MPLGYNCKDVDASDYHNNSCTAAGGEAKGDGYCDINAFNNDNHLNSARCQWDGGDCCPSTCSGECSHWVYDCQDPEASDVGESSACRAPNPAWLADGYCDQSFLDSDVYNSDACAWDGGDCCAETCVSGEFTCGGSTYVCLDPDVLANRTDESCNIDQPSYLGDGWCDGGDFNTEGCAWDGGDCCEETCTDDAYLCGVSSYNCLNPAYSLINWTETNCSASMDFFHYYADGYCDELIGPYNTRACGWDGGDCCNSTCVDAEYDCGLVGYNCKDTAASDYNNGECHATGESAGDGFCDIHAYLNSNHLNTANCDWDGGDCCRSTCMMPDGSDCESLVYECLDPTASDEGDVSACTAPNPAWLGDGWCDQFYADGDIYNSENCSWDGGDCCQETCPENATHSCGSTSFVCLDPIILAGRNETCNVDNVNYLADGWCDDDIGDYNTAGCTWDGGDCCESTCTDSTYICGAADYNCLDPDGQYLSCDVDYWWWLGDAFCDQNYDGYNTAACGWDGGDCCTDTCTDSNSYQCGTAGHHCLDPESSDYNSCPGINSTDYGNGFCDQYALDLSSHLNSAKCNWDGGDCCPSTCETADGSACSNIVYVFAF